MSHSEFRTMAFLISLVSLSIILIIISSFIGESLYLIKSISPDVDFPSFGFKRFAKVGNSSHNIIWMVQVSDIHLSMFHDYSRITEFSEFCNNTLNFINPSVVLATGDLTDSVTSDGYGGMQFEQEWIYYRDILEKNNITQRMLWLDIRGNHDNFNVLNINSDQNYYRKYTVQGKQHPHSYLYDYKMDNGEIITFVGVDACLSTGLRRPFNFIGFLREEELKILQFFAKTIDKNSTYAIWFGHYPTSTIHPPGGLDLRSLIASTNKSISYVSGHLHTLGGLVPNMYTYQNGFFELELGDWKANRIFRIMAIDHGEFAFIDVIHRNSPYILVTHPKGALLASSSSDPDLYAEKSEYIRILVFSPSKIDNVQVKLDEENWENCDHIKGPLYVSQWNASLYKKGLHTLQVKVVEDNKQVKVISHTFSLDGTRVYFKFLSNFFLIPSVSNIFQAMFYFMVNLSTLPLLLPRLGMIAMKKKWIATPNFNGYFLAGWIRRFWILANIDWFFWPLVLYPVFLVFGPWILADIVDGHVGIIFPWGIIVNRTFIPATPSYIIGYFHMAVFHFPMMLFLAAYLDRRSVGILYKTWKADAPKRFSVIRNKLGYLAIIWNNLGFTLVCMLMFVEIHHLFLSYGKLAVVFCPLKSWWLILVIWLRWRIMTVSSNTILKAGEVWIQQRNVD